MTRFVPPAACAGAPMRREDCVGAFRMQQDEKNHISK